MANHRREKHAMRRKLKKLLLKRQELIRRWKARHPNQVRLLPWKQGTPVHTTKQIAAGVRKRKAMKHA